MRPPHPSAIPPRPPSPPPPAPSARPDLIHRQSVDMLRTPGVGTWSIFASAFGRGWVRVPTSRDSDAIDTNANDIDEKSTPAWRTRRGMGHPAFARVALSERRTVLSSPFGRGWVRVPTSRDSDRMPLTPTTHIDEKRYCPGRRGVGWVILCLINRVAVAEISQG